MKMDPSYAKKMGGVQQQGPIIRWPEDKSQIQNNQADDDDLYA